MSDSEIKQRTVYCITKTIKDNNYDLYVGSTSNSLNSRLAEHKCKAKNENSKFYMRMREVGLDNWCIKPLLVLKCDREEIRKLENMCIKFWEADLNSISAIRTEDELKEQKKIYRQEHKEAIRQRKKIYRQENKEVIQQYKKQYLEKCVQDKKYFCSICNKAFQNKKDLERHKETLKHSYAYLNSID